jgi:hypothetical protein
MAWLPVAFLYLLVGIALISLCVAPVLVVWRAARVRPLLRKFQKLKGERSVVPREVAQSDEFKWAKHAEEVLQNTRTIAFLTIAALLVIAQAPVVLQGYAFPGLPQNLDEVNALIVGVAKHVWGMIERVGYLWAGVGLGAAIGGSLIAVNLLDLLGQAFGTPGQLVKDKIETAKKRAQQEAEEAKKLLEEAARGPGANMPNYYAELDIPTASSIPQVAARLDDLEKQWQRREKKGDATMQARAREYLAKIFSARDALLDPDSRAEYDRQIGLRGSGGGPSSGDRKKGPVDARSVGDLALRQIEELKKKRKKAKEAEETGERKKPGARTLAG